MVFCPHKHEKSFRKKLKLEKTILLVKYKRKFLYTKNPQRAIQSSDEITISEEHYSKATKLTMLNLQESPKSYELSSIFQKDLQTISPPVSQTQHEI